MSKGKARFTVEQLKIMGLVEDGNGGYKPKKEGNATFEATPIKGYHRENEIFCANKSQIGNPDKQNKPLLDMEADNLNEEDVNIFLESDPNELAVQRIASAIESYIGNHSSDASKVFLEELAGLIPDKNNTAPDGHLKIVVLGEPQAQKRHRHFTGKNMKFTQVYDPSKADKKDFLSVVQGMAPDTPFDRPLKLLVHFYFSRPKSHFRTGKFAHLMKDSAPIHHTGKPDVDNCFKFCTDALTKVYWRDDSLICQTEIVKEYSDNPRTEITIIPI